MGNGSPTAYLLWAILSCIYLVFLLLHLWNYDRFQCLKWDSGRQPGAFKRVMTYSYLGSVPLLVIFSVAITVLKFKEGFVVARDGSIVPPPYGSWNSANQRCVLPLYFVLSVAWSLEHITHLEELTFWVFLLNQGPGKREWFASWEFRIWTIGSFTTLTGMPTTVLSTRHNLDTCLAYIFLVGSAVGTTTTVCFFYVLFRFPWFIRYVKKEGAEPDVVIRLATFYQLNRIRVFFRFLFTIPLFIIALDGLRGPYPIISDPFAVDFLLMMGGIGCFISSAITLLIFFPRSITRESGYQNKAVSPQIPYATKLHQSDDYDNYQRYPFELRPTDNGAPAAFMRYHDPLPYDDDQADMDHDHNQYHTSSSTTRHVPSPKSMTGTRSLPRAYPASVTGPGALIAPDDDIGVQEEDQQDYSKKIPLQMQHHHQQWGTRRAKGRSGDMSFASGGSSSLGEMSPGYESDAETQSVAHSGVFVPPPVPPPQGQGASEEQRQRRNEREQQQKWTGEGHIQSSDDTFWDREHSIVDVQQESTTIGGESAALVRVVSGTHGVVRASGSGAGRAEANAELRKRRRRHSDGPFSFDESGRLVCPGVGPVKFGFGGIVIGLGSGSTSRRGKMRARDAQERYQELEQENEDRAQGKMKQRFGERARALERARVREESVLHPYLLNFTSPIDLHDGRGVRLTRSERGQVRRPPV